MGVDAISWALDLAPVPADRGGQPSSACKFVLVGFANHAGPGDTGAFRRLPRWVRYTGLAERTVRTCLDRMQTAGIIAALIKRADRLEAAGAFVVALAARRCWFCYQQLFAVRLRFGRRRNRTG